jgi:cystathionine beta-lyase
VYAPTRDLTGRVLSRLEITTDYHDPLIGGGISALIRENTRLIWYESLRSVTMEVEVDPFLVALATFW